MGLEFKKPNNFCEKIPPIIEELMEMLPEIPVDDGDHPYKGDTGAKRYILELEQHFNGFFENYFKVYEHNKKIRCFIFLD